MQRATVLVIDTDEALRERLASRLGDWGYRTVCTSGSEAAAIARAVRPDVILLEAQGQGLDGVAISHRLRSDVGTSHIPIVCLSADLARGIRNGMIADEWLAKPVGTDQLYHVLTRWVPQSSVAALA